MRIRRWIDIDSNKVNLSFPVELLFRRLNVVLLKIHIPSEVYIVTGYGAKFFKFMDIWK